MATDIAEAGLLLTPISAPLGIETRHQLKAQTQRDGRGRSEETHSTAVGTRHHNIGAQESCHNDTRVEYAWRCRRQRPVATMVSRTMTSLSTLVWKPPGIHQPPNVIENPHRQSSGSRPSRETAKRSPTPTHQQLTRRNRKESLHLQ